MRKVAYLTALSVFVALFLSVAGTAIAGEDCTTINDGTLTDYYGEPLVMGFDKFGYNYQGHTFVGWFCDNDRIPGGPYCDLRLQMKWNEALRSNKDCDGDGLLDEYPYPEWYKYQGTGAWLTNHQSQEYELDGKMCRWEWFIKVVAVPMGADLVDGVWYTADGVMIGPEIFGYFAIVQEVFNDPCGESPVYPWGRHMVSKGRRPGLGGWGGGQSAGIHSSHQGTFALLQNSPNPFTNETKIRFFLPEVTHTTLTIHDVSGRAIATLVDKELVAGTHAREWKTDVPSGMYFYRLQAGDFTDMKKMILLR